MSRRPKRFTVFRDVTSYLGGWALITYQALVVPPHDVNAWFLLIGGSLIGVPGVAEILTLRGRASTGIGMPDSSPRPPDSPLPESSSSSAT